ncbi:hypothetical protein [Nocardia jejuensis]|uniref:hypothetical protein n=1 Tax=Nocardia jejuensis TaxID=328049 RepID=UPI00082E959B|nr:hypothetical protein [Nocardia jejuensis]
MRTSLRHAVVACCLVTLTATAVVGCGSDDDSTAATTSAVKTSASSAAASGGSTASAADTKAVTDAYVTFFNGQTPAATRAGLVEKGAAFQPALEGMAVNPQATGTSVTVAEVKLSDATHADVKYTLLLNGTPALPDQSGQAVKDAGTWKVAAATFCALLSIQSGGQTTAC